MKTLFEEALEKKEMININGTSVNQAVYNLLICKRDVSLYIKGIIPHRFFKITDVKKYFGITGNGEKLLANFMVVYNQHIPKT